MLHALLLNCNWLFNDKYGNTFTACLHDFCQTFCFLMFLHENYFWCINNLLNHSIVVVITISLIGKTVKFCAGENVLQLRGPMLHRPIPPHLQMLRKFSLKPFPFRNRNARNHRFEIPVLLRFMRSSSEVERRKRNNGNYWPLNGTSKSRSWFQNYTARLVHQEEQHVKKFSS